jgi:hypothetical protein
MTSGRAAFNPAVSSKPPAWVRAAAFVAGGAWSRVRGSMRRYCSAMDSGFACAGAGLGWLNCLVLGWLGVRLLRLFYPEPSTIRAWASKRPVCRGGHLSPSLAAMRRIVPFPWIHPGDVLEVRRGFSVVTHVGEDGGGCLRIQAVRADDQPNQWKYPRKASPVSFARVGEGCTPSAEGLRAFLAQQPLSQPVGPGHWQTVRAGAPAPRGGRAPRASTTGRKAAGARRRVGENPWRYRKAPLA